MPTILPAFEGFKFGCDPELFVKDAEGRYVSAAGLIPGTKQIPHKVEKGAVQVDGMAAEFNTDPASSFEEFDTNITTVMKQLQAMLPKGYSLDAVPAVRFNPAVFEAAPDEAKELGCTPDFNAWTGQMNPPPDLPDDPYLRTASGHLHIGWTEDADITELQHVINCQDLVKQLDWYLGGWSLKSDPDTTRRRLYGKAGACRFKPYGVEYRVLSNFWVTSKNHRLTVWNRMQYALSSMRHMYVPDRVNKYHNQMLQDRINEGIIDPSFDKLFYFPMHTTDESYARI